MKKAITLSIIMLLGFLARAQSINHQLMVAVVEKDTTLIAELLGKGGDVNYAEKTDGIKVNLLIFAVTNSDLPTIKLLIAHKADVNWRDSYKDTALIYAAQIEDLAIIKYLLDNGADVHVDDGQGHSVLSTAKAAKNPEVLKLIQSKL